MVSPISLNNPQVTAQADKVNQRQKQQQDEIRKAQENQTQAAASTQRPSGNDHDKDDAGGRTVNQNQLQSYNVSLDVRA